MHKHTVHEQPCNIYLHRESAIRIAVFLHNYTLKLPAVFQMKIFQGYFSHNSFALDDAHNHITHFNASATICILSRVSIGRPVEYAERRD